MQNEEMQYLEASQFVRLAVLQALDKTRLEDDFKIVTHMDIVGTQEGDDIRNRRVTTFRPLYCFSETWSRNLLCQRVDGLCPTFDDDLYIFPFKGIDYREDIEKLNKQLDGAPMSLRHYGEQGFFVIGETPPPPPYTRERSVLHRMPIVVTRVGSARGGSYINLDPPLLQRWQSLKVISRTERLQTIVNAAMKPHGCGDSDIRTYNSDFAIAFGRLLVEDIQLYLKELDGKISGKVAA
ncbi:MAG: hypothetical protein U0487_00940 [Patescibacteria group bacterium]